MASADPQSGADSSLRLGFQHGGKAHTFSFAPDATIVDFSNRVSEELGIPQSNQKFLISPKPGMIKPPFDEPSKASMRLSSIVGRKIILLGSTPAQISSLNQSVASAKPRDRYSGPVKPAKPAPTRDRRKDQAALYTFMDIKPLDYLPDPERSTRFLERLRDDPGIRFTMAKHKWTVPLLTEMDPSQHTQHSYEGVGRTLGLNRNGGQIIELRLRTDAFDGYRDYKTIRNTLCHELAHNVHGPHDRNFWDLCHQIEREVESGDWKSGGHALSSQEFYDPGASSAADTRETWTGGARVLGTSKAHADSSSRAGSGANSSAAGGAALDRREMMARAAEERARRAKEDQS